MLRWSTRLKNQYTRQGISGIDMKLEGLLASFLKGARPILHGVRSRVSRGRSKFEATVGTRFLGSELDETAKSTLQESWRALSDAAMGEKQRTSSNSGEVAAFTRGYEFSNRGFLQPPLSPCWKELALGEGRLRVEENLPYAIVQKNGVSVVLLGVAIDSEEGVSDGNLIADRIADLILFGNSLEAIDEYAVWLGGRFVLIVGRGEQWRIHVDAMASRSCYWTVRNNQLFAASHSALVAREIGEFSRKRAYWVLSNSDYVSAAGKWLPGRITPHDCTDLVSANCVLSFDGESGVHSRIFPLEKHRVSAEYSPKEVARILIGELRVQTSAWLNTSDNSYLALTAGQDSLVVLLSCIDIFQKQFTKAMTYIFAEKNDPLGVRDLQGANFLALISDLQHKVVQVKPFVFDGRFAAAYKKTFPNWARFPALAKSMWQNFPKDSVVLFGIGGEIGTVFYKDRVEGSVNGEILASKFTTSKFSSNPDLIREMEEYISFTQLNSVSSSLASFYDLYYWENRMTNWAAAGYSEYELGPSIGLPFNTRRIIWPMLNLSYENRLNKAVYKTIFRWSGWPL